VTIGIGFRCADGIVLVADQQISYGTYYKKYECKIFTHNTSDWAIGMIYSGDPELMRVVDEKFTEAMVNTYQSKKPGTASEIKKLLEKTLSGMKTLDAAQDPEGFYMLCGVVIPNKEMALIRTERKKVREVKELSSYVGIGDSSVLQYLTKILVANNNVLNAKQAMYIGVYLTVQAKAYIHACGGETDSMILKQNGDIEPHVHQYNEEQQVLRLEFSLTKMLSVISDPSKPDAEFDSAFEKCRIYSKNMRLR
jgi:20S proteasome alpha/beta subunit